MVASKYMMLFVSHAQARRVTCDRCDRPFCYLIGEAEFVRVDGFILTSDDTLRGQLAAAVDRQLGKLARQRWRGQALCPHCHCHPKWMVRRSMLSNIGGWGVVLAVLGGFLAVIANMVKKWQYPPSALAVIGALVGGLIGLAIGYAISLKGGPYHDRDHPRSLTDEQFQALVQKSLAEGRDPVLAWEESTSNRVPPKDAPPGDGPLVVTLGFMERADPPLVLPEAGA